MGNIKKPKRKRTEFIAFYVTEKEKEAIVERAYSNDQTVSDYCRKMLTRGVQNDVRENT